MKEPLKEGRKAPAFRLREASVGMVSLSEFAGRTGMGALSAAGLQDGTNGTGTLRLSAASPAAQEVK